VATLVFASIFSVFLPNTPVWPLPNRNLHHAGHIAPFHKQAGYPYTPIAGFTYLLRCLSVINAKSFNSTKTPMLSKLED